MHLVDSNIFLEIMLGQAKAPQARALVAAHAGKSLHMSDFSLHSLGVILWRKKRPDAFVDFLKDLVVSGSVNVLQLSPEELTSVADASHQQGLDFDDAYQYVVAEKYDLTIISFDVHFDRTRRGRSTPEQILSSSGKGNV
jgi:predicted nucleic acid-binding protein